MEIGFSKEQYAQLLEAVHTASSIYGILGDSVSEEFKAKSDTFEKLEDFLADHARDFGYDAWLELFEGRFVLNERAHEELHEAIEEYEEYAFWDNLALRLGRRDFDRERTPEEEKKSEETGWLPERIYEYYGKYEQEFEDHGIDRLEMPPQKDS